METPQEKDVIRAEEGGGEEEGGEEGEDDEENEEDGESEGAEESKLEEESSEKQEEEVGRLSFNHRKSVRRSNTGGSCDVRSSRVRNKDYIRQEIQKQKKRKAKLVEEKQEIRRLARSHFEEEIEGTHTKIPYNVQCHFNSQNTGLGGMSLRGSYKASKDVQEKISLMKREPASQTKWSNTSLPPIQVSKRHSFLSYRSKEIVPVGQQASTESRDISKAKIEPQSIQGSTFSQLADWENVSVAETASFTSVRSNAKIDNFPRGRCRKGAKIRFDPPFHIVSRLKGTTATIPWLEERLALAVRSVRYEIPMDVREFIGMDVKTYLCNFCKISSGRMLGFQRLFKLYKSPTARGMTCSELSRAVQVLSHDVLRDVCTTKFLQSLEIGNNIGANVDLELCSVVAATAERILNLSFVEAAGKPIPPGKAVSALEVADFSSLKAMLNGVNICPQLWKLLFSLG